MTDRPNMLLGSRKAWRSGSAANRGRSLGLSGTNAIDWVEQVRKGFPYTTLIRFHKKSGLPLSTVAELIGLPQRTLMRRKAEGRLQPDESERILRVSGVFEQAVALFEGDADSARRWLTTPSKELDDLPPLEFARTEIGAREVENLIGRLEHGVFT